MKHIIFCLLLLTFFGVEAQQINPVPDYVFKNQMSVGRNAVTDTAAYFSIGPRFGATKGMMPPMVGDTANVSATKRNGLLIFSLQKNKYLYWDSVGAKWAEMAGTTGSAIAGTLTTNYLPKATGTSTLGNSIMYDSSGHLRAYKNSLGNISDTRQALTVAMDGQNGYAFVVQQNDSLDNNIQYALSIRKNLLTSGKPRPGFGAAYDIKVPDDAGTMRRIGAQLFRLSDTTAAGISSYMQLQLVKSGNAITPLQISSDSSVRLAKLAGIGTRYVVADANGDLTATSSTSSTVGGSGTTNYVPKFTASSTIGNSQIFDDGTNVGINTTSPATYGGARLAAYQASGSTIIASKTDDATGGAGIYLEGSNSSNNITQIRQFSASTAGTISGINLASGSFMYTSATSAGPLALVQQASQPILFATGGSERMRITSAGNLGVGTSTPDARLDVANTITSDYTSAARFRNSDAGAGNFRNVGIEFWDRYTTVNAAIIGARNTVSGNWQGDLVFKNAQGASPSTDPSTLTEVMRFNGQSKRIQFLPDGTERMRLTSDAELIINTTTDAGAYALQVTGAIYNTTTITTGAPTSGSAKPWRLGEAATVSPTSPNRTIRVEIDGTVYYIHAKTTND